MLTKFKSQVKLTPLMLIALIVLSMPLNQAFAQNHRASFCCFSHLRVMPADKTNCSKELNNWLSSAAQKIVDLVYKDNKLLVAERVKCSFVISEFGNAQNIKVTEESIYPNDNKNAVKLIEKTFSIFRPHKDLGKNARLIAVFRPKSGYFIKIALDTSKRP